jgi:hypothetical protein
MIQDNEKAGNPARLSCVEEKRKFNRRLTQTVRQTTAIADIFSFGRHGRKKRNSLRPRVSAVKKGCLALPAWVLSGNHCLQGEREKRIIKYLNIALYFFIM